MTKLTETQQAALKYAEYSELANNYFCDPVEWSLRTLRSLERRGYLSAAPFGHRFWLTGKGADERHKLLYETCGSCGKDTHENEAACIHCGKLKEGLDD